MPGTKDHLFRVRDCENKFTWTNGLQRQEYEKHRISRIASKLKLSNRHSLSVPSADRLHMPEQQRDRFLHDVASPVHCSSERYCSVVAMQRR